MGIPRYNPPQSDHLLEDEFYEVQTQLLPDIDADVFVTPRSFHRDQLFLDWDHQAYPSSIRPVDENGEELSDVEVQSELFDAHLDSPRGLCRWMERFRVVSEIETDLSVSEFYEESALYGAPRDFHMHYPEEPSVLHMGNAPDVVLSSRISRQYPTENLEDPYNPYEDDDEFEVIQLDNEEDELDLIAQNPLPIVDYVNNNPDVQVVAAPPYRDFDEWAAAQLEAQRPANDAARERFHRLLMVPLASPPIVAPEPSIPRFRTPYAQFLFEEIERRRGRGEALDDWETEFEEEQEEWYDAEEHPDWLNTVIVNKLDCIVYDNPELVRKLVCKVIPNSTTTNAGTKQMQPVIPATPHEKGTTGQGVPLHGDMPASSTVAGGLSLPNDPQVRASRDIPAQAPLMLMQGGPPDMSQMNMYQDDILNLVYRQFHVGQMTIQGSQTLGSIVLRLPYGINLLSVYAQNWARLHKRYNGRIRITFSMSAVPMLRGNILIGVVRNMPADSVTTMTAQQLQKINWVIVNLNGSGEYAMDIGDARQTKFFRDVSEDPISGPPTDIAERPGIIGIVYTPIVNQFGADSDNSVVINIRSAAISPLEDPVFGFKAWEPIDAAITTRSLSEEAPALVYARDILPTIDNRSLYIDGAKVIKTTASNLYSLDPTKGVAFPLYRTSFETPTTAPYWFSADNRSFMLCLEEMDPLSFSWGNNAHPSMAGNTYPFMADLISGAIVNQNPNNAFLGTLNGSEDIATKSLEVYTSDGSAHTQDCTLKQVQILTFQHGRLIFCFFEITASGWDFTKAIGSVTPVMAEVGIHTILWPIGADTSTTADNLPNGYYNVTTALDGQNQYLATIGPQPTLFPDKAFTRYFLSLRDRLYGRGESLTLDLVDTRNTTTVGILFTLEDQVVIRTSVPNPASSHYRFNVDLQYMGFANPRRTFGQPQSDAAQYLTPLDLTRGTSKYDIIKAIQAMDKSFLDACFREPGIVKPNAVAAGMMAAGAIAGFAQGGLNWLAAKNNLNNQLELQDNLIDRKFGAQWALNQQQYQYKMNMMGARNFQAQPGAATSAAARAESHGLPSPEPHPIVTQPGPNERVNPPSTRAQSSTKGGVQIEDVTDHDWTNDPVHNSNEWGSPPKPGEF